jgi:hypothetical protein
LRAELRHILPPQPANEFERRQTKNVCLRKGLNKLTNHDTIEIFKSLLQKAVRRGNVEMAKKAINFLARHDFPWLRARLAVLAFEECWTYGGELLLTQHEESVAEQITTLATTIKNRNVAGLGALAYYYSDGDSSMLGVGNDDNAIRTVAAGFKNAGQYWVESTFEALTVQQHEIVERAKQGFDLAVFPWDKCFMIAATYLATTGKIPETRFSKTSNELPLWVAIDKHTPIGQAAIGRAAATINFDEQKAQWLVFYLEGVKCNQIVHSPWWDREKEWRFRQLGLSDGEAEKHWQILRPVLIGELKNATEELGALL